MVVLKVILGILMVFGSCTILSMPLLSAVIICWMVSIAMLIVGIVTIIKYIEKKNAEKVAAKEGRPVLRTGVGSLIFGIVAIILSILARSSVIGQAVFMQIIAVLFGLWLVLSGISMIVSGTALKKLAASGWLPMIILGVFVAVMGVVCIVNSFTGLVAVGTMFGISMMMSGFALIFQPIEG